MKGGRSRGRSKRRKRRVGVEKKKEMIKKNTQKKKKEMIKKNTQKKKKEMIKKNTQKKKKERR